MRLPLLMCVTLLMCITLRGESLEVVTIEHKCIAATAPHLTSRETEAVVITDNWRRTRAVSLLLRQDYFWIGVLKSEELDVLGGYRKDIAQENWIRDRLLLRPEANGGRLRLRIRNCSGEVGSLILRAIIHSLTKTLTKAEAEAVAGVLAVIREGKEAIRNGEGGDAETLAELDNEELLYELSLFPPSIHSQP
jgi:hypothetical protein